MSFTRKTQFGSFTKQIRERDISVSTRFWPGAAGYTEMPSYAVGPSSIISGVNTWYIDGELQPRDLLTTIASDASNSLGDQPTGTLVYDGISGGRAQMVFSQRTVGYYADKSLITLNFDSTVSNLPLSGNENDNVFGTSVYLPRADINIALFTNGLDPIYSWAGPSVSTAYSVLTGSPIAADITLFDNRPVAWNIQELSSNSRFVQRVQWPVAGDPEDWTGIGSGSEDLVDMRGQGTRIFALENEMILATNREIWRGRKVGLPFVFQFQPLEQNVGMPYQRAAVETEHGIFWLNDDYQIRHLDNGQITEIGDPIRDTLRRELVNFEKAFLSYNPIRKVITLHYSSVADGLPNKAFSWMIDAKVWMPQQFPVTMGAATEGVAALSTGTTWGNLTGTLGSQSLTFEQMLGVGAGDTEILWSSTGTGYGYATSGTSDAGSTFTCEAVLGGLFPENNKDVKGVDEIYIDARADTASVVTLSVSGNLGATYPYSKSFSPSVQSNISQTKLNTVVSGSNPSLRIQGNAGRWKIGQIDVRARGLGKTL